MGLESVIYVTPGVVTTPDAVSGTWLNGSNGSTNTTPAIAPAFLAEKCRVDNQFMCIPTRITGSSEVTVDCSTAVSSLDSSSGVGAKGSRTPVKGA